MSGSQGIHGTAHSCNNNTPELIQSILIPKYNQYDTIKVTGEDEGTTGYFIAEPDSVVFAFNDARKKVYTRSIQHEIAQSINSCQEDGNIILYMETPNTFDNKRKGYDYEYIITDMDYENASPF